MDDPTGDSPGSPIREDELVIRPGSDSDRHLILSTWLKVYRRHSSFTRNISNPVFFEWHQRVIKRLFERGAVANVCALKEDPLIVFGYLVTEHIDGCEQSGANPTIHFAYVKYSFQRMGIMRRLITSARIDLTRPTEYTHHTHGIEPIINKYPKLRYNPYLL